MNELNNEENSTSPTTNPIVQEQVINNINIKPYKELTNQEKAISNFCYQKNKSSVKEFIYRNIGFTDIAVIAVASELNKNIILIIAILIFLLIILSEEINKRNYYKKNPEKIVETDELKEEAERNKNKEKLPFKYMLLMMLPMIIAIILTTYTSLPLIVNGIIIYIGWMIFINLFFYFCTKYKLN